MIVPCDICPLQIYTLNISWFRTAVFIVILVVGNFPERRNKAKYNDNDSASKGVHVRVGSGGGKGCPIPSENRYQVGLKIGSEISWVSYPRK